MYMKGKDMRKKRHLAAFVVLVLSVFREKFSTAEF
jgi:hypothetical protein